MPIIVLSDITYSNFGDFLFDVFCNGSDKFRIYISMRLSACKQAQTHGS